MSGAKDAAKGGAEAAPKRRRRDDKRTEAALVTLEAFGKLTGVYKAVQKAVDEELGTEHALELPAHKMVEVFPAYPCPMG
jgi:hypothetical protein